MAQVSLHVNLIHSSASNVTDGKTSDPYKAQALIANLINIYQASLAIHAQLVVLHVLIEKLA